MKIEKMDILDMNTRVENKLILFTVFADAVAVLNPKFEKRINKIFITGVIPKGITSNDWGAGKPCAVSWDAVTDYMLFESEKQYLEFKYN